MLKRKTSKTGSNGGAERLVAVVTPIVQFPLSADEEISLRHLRKYLGSFDRYVIGLGKLPPELSDFRLGSLPLRHFKDHAGYSRMMLKKEFYRAFSEYEYILIYQLDCLVFDSNLEQWCRMGWDYVGAPWLKDINDPRKGLWGVGNGGLSLRRVDRAIEVLSSQKYWEDPKTRGSSRGRFSEVMYKALGGGPHAGRLIVKAKTLLHRSGYRNNVRWLVRRWGKEKIFEDIFWAYEARKLVPEFRIPGTRQALEFSFEMAPRYCFEQNAHRLPFGCHAWGRYDREFWQPFLLK